jgi:hypothetical protein
MNNATQAALMSKASKVFASEDTFLSFPVSPLPFSPGDLELQGGATADEARQRLHNLLAFSTLVNLLPGDEAWLPGESRFLWDVYEQVLKEANFATSNRTDDEDAAYQKALDTLRNSDGAGGWKDSDAVQAYRQHKDAWLLAQQRYRADKITAETTTDPEQRLTWSTVEEPDLRSELEALQARWIVDGHKSEVESAQSILVSLGARAPIQTWAEWRSRFNPDLDRLTGTSDTTTFYPSYFSPSNALEEAAWRPFKLSADEIAVLLREAPAEMKERLAIDIGSVSDATSLAFEFSSALVVRPWFVPDVFRSRFWRFSDGARVISGGGSPSTGECPAYVTAIVFARKVVEQRPPSVPPVGGPFSGFRFLVAVRDVEKRNSIAQQPRSQIAPGMLASRISAAAVRPALAQQLNVRQARAAMPGLETSASSGMARSHTMLFKRTATQGLPRLAEPSPAPPPASTPPPASPDDSVYVLAFVCKRVPLCPNPDPRLQW